MEIKFSNILPTFREGLGSFVLQNFASLVNKVVCQKTKHGTVSSVTYIICDPLYENRTYEAISNFEKGAK